MNHDPNLTTELPDDDRGALRPSPKPDSSLNTNHNPYDASLPTESHQAKLAVHDTDQFSQRYKLIEPIGEGGMGTVWRASQIKPMRREVAVKLIKPGMDSKSVLARFDAERQALAIMDHPNIARVLDGGMTDDGRPYFVMELVRGLPLTEYCDQKRLSVHSGWNFLHRYVRRYNMLIKKGLCTGT